MKDHTLHSARSGNGNEKAAEGSAFSIIPTFSLERELLEQGHSLIAGIDEAGRGSLAGPLSVGLVIYDASFIRSNPRGIPGINDSKKLTPRRRNDAMEIIRRHSIAVTSILVNHRVIDRLNINGATEYGILNLLKLMPCKPDIILLDGNFSFNLGVPVRSILKGDTRSVSIASASIAAKVRRDAVLDTFDSLYPGYNFRRNKGYGTREHIRAIIASGCSPVHRTSYEPVKSMFSRES